MHVIRLHSMHCVHSLWKLKQTLATYVASMCNSNLQGPVVRKMDSAIHWRNHYPLDSGIDFPNTYMLDNDLPGG